MRRGECGSGRPRTTRLDTSILQEERSARAGNRIALFHSGKSVVGQSGPRGVPNTLRERRAAFRTSTSGWPTLRELTSSVNTIPSARVALWSVADRVRIVQQHSGPCRNVSAAKEYAPTRSTGGAHHAVTELHLHAIRSLLAKRGSMKYRRSSFCAPFRF